jgi:polysaccharide export outer membrane protein
MIGRALRLILTASAAAAITASGLLAQAPTGDADIPVSKKNFIYRLSLGDRIRVAVFQEDDLSAIPRVNAQGMVTLPLIGDVRVSGLTISEAQGRIEKALKDGRFMRAPQVNITVEEYAAREVSILGQVRNPGKYALPVESTLTVVELVTRAGGFTDIGKGTEVRITRIGPDGQETNFTVDVESVIRGRGRSRIEDNSMLLEAGDIVYVPERFI